MTKYYFKISARKMLGNLTISSINILGLAIGFFAFILITEYVAFENSYDRPNDNIDNLYRITTDSYKEHKLLKRTAKTTSGIGKLMQDNLPEVIKQTRVLYSDGFSVSYEDQDYIKLKLMSVDSSFLSMFEIKLMAGNIHNALEAPKSVVLTENLAKRIFGDVKDYSLLIGKPVKLGTLIETITGVCADPPENASFQFDLLSSYNTLYADDKGGVSEFNYGFTELDFFNFIQLEAGSDHQTTERKVQELVRNRFSELIKNGNQNIFHLQPFNSIHFSKGLEDEMFKTNRATSVWGLFFIGLFLLAIAWINYVNMAVAQSLERTKEMSLRKLSGATSGQLLTVFMAESFLVNFLALVIALGGISVAQNSFNHLINHNLGIGILFDKVSIRFPIIFAIIFFCGIMVTALYPAYLLSKMNPVIGLKGKVSESLSVGVLRKLLVGFQLTITMILVSATLIVYKQVSFFSKGDLGYNMSQMLVVYIPACTFSEQNVFMDKIRALPNVEAVAASNFVPGGELFNKGGVKIDHSNVENGLTVQTNTVSPEFIDTYKMSLCAGRNFTVADCIDVTDSITKTIRDSSSKIIINEKAVGYLSLQSPADAIGKLIFSGGDRYTIVGVVKDFRQKTFYYPIQPIILFPAKSTLWRFSIKLKTHDLSTTLSTIQSEYKAFFSGRVFDYFFADDSFNLAYQGEIVFSNILMLFLLTSILLASISIFCISMFYCIKRKRELSIRKILGASVLSIVWSLSRDFFLLGSIAFIVSSCLTMFLAHQWLNGFSYRISLSPWFFVGTALLILFWILMVTGLQTVKAALASPVKGIASE